ncbi:YifB family Mg chelatase-like AAA ATPase [Sediminivirga luteola]|uniref:YifB family Mg chelatase-like AAA ATPase n=1 Tax=Sediminivirga luteola TaxID=1774748 RepID=UPI00166EE750|nr:YifB family Mg chelatase-like AAA ATPase [Sediminivirga luteola]MCI2264899.1 YifB family Mg chelatase-like AAA ATPase [Sediminivirga luteola]
MSAAPEAGELRAESPGPARAAAPVGGGERRLRLGRARAIGLEGLRGHLVTVEASLNDGLPAMTVVGLPDASVNEARQRIRTALSNSGCAMPATRITVNLSPGELRKVGTVFDLAIAVAVMAAAGHLHAGAAEATVHLGELGLDGRLHPVRGVIAALLAAREAGIDRAVVPAGNAAEAALVQGMRIRTATSLAEAANIHGANLPAPQQPMVSARVPERAPGGPAPADLAAVRGQVQARWALEVAAAGGHHMLMIGTPGAGKTLLASALPGILPPLSEEEAVEVAAVRSLAGVFDPETGLDRTPPFVAPHHRTSPAAMTGSPRRAGLMAQAHHGVLFMDEAPEFRRDALELLRQPLESARYSVDRAAESATFPASFQLVMAANPCPCGKAVGTGIGCECPPMARRRYAARLSGPVRDRMDVHLELHPVALKDLQDTRPQEASADVAARVRRAREAQRRRYQGLPWRLNAQADASWLRERYAFSPAEIREIDEALRRGLLSMRGYDRVVRVAASIADVAGRERPTREDLLAALTLRHPEATP